MIAGAFLVIASSWYLLRLMGNYASQGEALVQRYQARTAQLEAISQILSVKAATPDADIVVEEAPSQGRREV